MRSGCGRIHGSLLSTSTSKPDVGLIRAAAKNNAQARAIGFRPRIVFLVQLCSQQPRRQRGKKMTELTIKLKDESRLGLLLAMLRRLVTSEGVELSVERNGLGVALDRATDDDARFDAIVNQIIEDAIAGRLEPLSEEEQRESAEYWEKVGAELNLSDDDIVRLVKETRAEERARTVA